MTTNRGGRMYIPPRLVCRETASIAEDPLSARVLRWRQGTLQSASHLNPSTCSRPGSCRLQRMGEPVCGPLLLAGMPSAEKPGQQACLRLHRQARRAARADREQGGNAGERAEGCDGREEVAKPAIARITRWVVFVVRFYHDANHTCSTSTQCFSVILHAC